MNRDIRRERDIYRQGEKERENYYRTATGQRSVKYQGYLTWSTLYDSLKQSASLRQLKFKYKQYLCNSKQSYQFKNIYYYVSNRNYVIIGSI